MRRNGCWKAGAMPQPRNKQASGAWSRPQDNKLPIAVVLVASIVVGGILVGYGISQLPGGSPPVAQEVAKQLEADQRQAAQQTEQAQVAAQASQATTIAEGQVVSADVANLKAMRSEFDDSIAALNEKAKASATASRRWDRVWADRRAAYTSRYAAVRSHNYSERQRYYASKTERANSSGRLVVVYTYRPRYWGYPAQPRKPGLMSVTVAPEIERLSALQGQVDALMSTIASQTPAAQSFGSVYQTLATAAQALGTTVGDATTVARTVVKKAARGHVIDGAKLSKVDPAALDAPFGELDRSFSDALTAYGLTPAQVATGGAGAQ